MTPIVQVRHVSKQYQLGESVHRFDTLMEYVGRSLRRSRKSPPEAATQWIWSLRDVSFDVAEGDVTGIIGRNGAGKSTLLKILSRITDPSEGYVKLRGRSASLLEVGTGFHPDLTGRENIFLNGSILGMSKAEIQSKFDEIVAFSELERFIDTPVKRYSSGMYVRLAFAVAAHLEPEILIVDEVLAVGDMAFQKKCLGKMGDVSKTGRTILFVSHNMAAVENLCRTGIVLSEGKLVYSGSSKAAVNHYVHTVFGGGQTRSHIVDLGTSSKRASRFRPLVQSMELCTDGGMPIGDALPYGNPLVIDIMFRLERPTPNYDVLISFNTLLGDPVFVAQSSFEPECSIQQGGHEQVFTCEIPSLTLVPAEYMINVAIVVHDTVVDCIEDVVRLSVSPVDYYGTGKVPKHGVAVIPHRWRSRVVEKATLAGSARAGMNASADDDYSLS